MLLDETALKPGDVIADYRIDRVLGAGSFGVTYLATDTNLSRQVAIKEYLPGDYARRDASGTVSSRSAEAGATFEWGLERFTEEARTLAQFSHPNIVRVLHIVQRLNGTAYIVMELLEGRDFEEVVEKSGPLSVPQFLTIFAQLLDGMKAVHGVGVLHRDIKPSNIMLSGETPVLIDFGAARDLARQRKAGFSALVTDGYSPIEQYSSQNLQSEASDIYALAATAHFLLSGKTPPMPAARMAGDELTPTAQLAPDLPADVAAGIDWGMALQMADRPQTIAQWRAAMPSLDAVPTVEPEIVYVDRGGTPIKRRALLLGGAGVVLAAGAGGFLLFRDASISGSARPLTASWTKPVSGLFGEPFAAVVATEAGIVAAAHELGEDGSDRALVARADPASGAITRFVLDQPGSRAHALFVGKAGETYFGGEVGEQAMLTCLDRNLQSLWTRTYESGSISSILSSKSGLIAGLEGPESSGKAKLLFIAGDGTQTADVTLLDRQGDTVQQVIALADGAIAVLGLRKESRIVAGTKSEVSSLWLAKVALSGEELWRVAESGAGVAIGWGVIEAGGNLYVTGRTHATDAPDATRMLAMRISGDGTKDWSRWDYPGSPASGRGLALSPSGALYVVGWAGQPARARLSQLGPGGDLLWDDAAKDAVGFSDGYGGMTFAPDGTAYALYLRAETEPDLSLNLRKFA